MKIGIVIQARLGSSRLPKKILKSFDHQTILMFIIQRLKVLNLPIIVATTDNVLDDELVDYLLKNNINTFRGSENNVLQRFIECAKQYELTHVLRICSDSPFMDINHLNQLIENVQPDKDYISNSFNGKPTILTHFGIFGEIVKLDALVKLTALFPDEKSYKEHVTFGIYNNAQIFKIKLLEIDNKFNDYASVRLTIDTEDDYQILQIIDNYFDSKENLTFFEVADYLKTNQDLLLKMEATIASNKK